MCSCTFCLCYTTAWHHRALGVVESHTEATEERYYLHKHAVFRIKHPHDTLRDQSQNNCLETHGDTVFTQNSQTGQIIKHNNQLTRWSVTFISLIIIIMTDFWRNTTWKREKFQNTSTKKSYLLTIITITV